jgi:hypothetical protein
MTNKITIEQAIKNGFGEYFKLPFSEILCKELLKRHSHASILNDIDCNQIVYTEKDVLRLLQIHEIEIKKIYDIQNK